MGDTAVNMKQGDKINNAMEIPILFDHRPMDALPKKNMSPSLHSSRQTGPLNISLNLGVLPSLQIPVLEPQVGNFVGHHGKANDSSKDSLFAQDLFTQKSPQCWLEEGTRD